MKVNKIIWHMTICVLPILIAQEIYFKVSLFAPETSNLGIFLVGALIMFLNTILITIMKEYIPFKTNITLLLMFVLTIYFLGAICLLKAEQFEFFAISLVYSVLFLIVSNWCGKQVIFNQSQPT